MPFYIQKFELDLNEKIYQRIRIMLFEQYPFYPDIDLYDRSIVLSRALAFDSLDMFNIMISVEQEFNVYIDKDDIDEFTFQPLKGERLGNIKRITIQYIVDYIEYQIRSGNFIKK